MLVKTHENYMFLCNEKFVNVALDSILDVSVTVILAM